MKKYNDKNRRDLTLKHVPMWANSIPKLCFWLFTHIFVGRICIGQEQERCFCEQKDLDKL